MNQSALCARAWTHEPKPHEEMNLAKALNERSGNLNLNVPKNPDEGKGNWPKAGGQAK
jgi:hypothetical protein